MSDVPKNEPVKNDDPKKSTSIDLAHFQTAYSENAPWDIGKPQPALISVADEITGSILDSGCGTGENALFFAARGHDVTGFDFFEGAIAAAKQKAAQRGLNATFLMEDALNLQNWTAQFDNVIDCGLFHVFSDEDRKRYVRGIEMVIERAGDLYLLCFSERTPGTAGPRRVTQNELIATFQEGWEIESIEPARFEVRPEMRDQIFGAKTRTHGLWLQDAPSSGRELHLARLDLIRPLCTAASLALN